MADIVMPGQPAGGPINSGSMPSNYDIEIYEGDTFKFRLTLTDANGAALNLGGYTAKAQLKTNYADTSPIEFVCVITLPNIVDISLAASTTATLDVNESYIYDVQLTSAGGEVRTYLTGDVTVRPEVTT